MGLVDEARDGLSEAELLPNLASVDDGPIEIRLLERVAEAAPEFVEHLATRIKRHWAPDRGRHRAQLVDAVAMIAMSVGHDHAVQPGHLGAQQLLTKVRPAVDEHAVAGAFYEDRGPEARIARLGGVALSPFIADLGNTGRRPAT